MVTTAAVLTCVLLAALAVFQVMLAAGAPWGRFAWGGQHRVLPTSLRVGSAVAPVIYALLAGVVLARADLVGLGLSDGVVDVLAWVVTGYFVIGIVLNAASRSKPERMVMTPLCVVLAVLTALVALS